MIFCFLTGSSSGAYEGIESRTPRFRLVIRSKKGKVLTFQMKDEQEKVEWLTVLSDICNRSTQDESSGGAATSSN